MPLTKKYLQLRNEIETCTQCRLHENRIHAVPGDGTLDAKIILIGEAPGYREDIKGLPFVGTAGKILDELLDIAGLSRNNVYITNLVKCRPPNNRPPKPDELNICTGQYLEKQLKMFEPKVICAMGNYASKYIMSRFSFEFSKIGMSHGKICRKMGKNVIPLYHPAAVLHQPPLRNVLKRDWRKMGRQIDKLGLR